MKRTRIKLCGMRKQEQVAAAVALGVDAIGMIFFAQSQRAISLEQAQKIRDVVPAFVSLVGVFVNESPQQINAVAAAVGLDLVQLHGDETGVMAAALNVPYLRAIRVKDANYVSEQLQEHNQARGFLLDTYHKQQYGGTGQTFDSALLPDNMPEDCIFAGGINAENVANVLKNKPFALDVNSGVEVAPADKDLPLLQRLIQRVREHDAKNMN